MSDNRFVLHAQTGDVERSVEDTGNVSVALRNSNSLGTSAQPALSQSTLHRSNDDPMHGTFYRSRRRSIAAADNEDQGELNDDENNNSTASGNNARAGEARRTHHRYHPQQQRRHRTGSNGSARHSSHGRTRSAAGRHTRTQIHARRSSSFDGDGDGGGRDEGRTNSSNQLAQSSLLQIPSVLASQMVGGRHDYNNNNYYYNDNDDNNNHRAMSSGPNNGSDVVPGTAELNRHRLRRGSQGGETSARSRRRHSTRHGGSARRPSTGSNNRAHNITTNNTTSAAGAPGGNEARGGHANTTNGGNPAHNPNRNSHWVTQQSLIIAAIAQEHYDTHGRETNSLYVTPRAMPLNTHGITHVMNTSITSQAQAHAQQALRRGTYPRTTNTHRSSNNNHYNRSLITGNASPSIQTNSEGAAVMTGVSPHPYEMYNPQFFERMRLREEVFNRPPYVLTKPPLVVVTPLLTDGPWRQSLLRSVCGGTPEAVRLCRLRRLLKCMSQRSERGSRSVSKRVLRVGQPLIAMEDGGHGGGSSNNNNNNEEEEESSGRHESSRSHSRRHSPQYHHHRRYHCRHTNEESYAHDPTNSVVEATALSLAPSRPAEERRGGAVTPGDSAHGPADYLTSDSRTALPATRGGQHHANNNNINNNSNSNSSAVHPSQGVNGRGGGAEGQGGTQTMTRTHSRASDLTSEIAFDETSLVERAANANAGGVDHGNLPLPPAFVHRNATAANETPSQGTGSAVLTLAEARTQYILDRSIGTAGNPLSSNGSMQHASGHTTQEGLTENDGANNVVMQSGGALMQRGTTRAGASASAADGPQTSSGMNRSLSLSDSSSEPRLLRRRNTTQPATNTIATGNSNNNNNNNNSNTQAQTTTVEVSSALNTTPRTRGDNRETGRGSAQASYSPESSVPSRPGGRTRTNTNEDTVVHEQLTHAAMAPLTCADHVRHFMRRCFCTRCTIAEQSELLFHEEKWRHYAPYRLCCECYFGNGSSYRHTMCAMCLCDIITLGIPCGCWYHGLGTALFGWRLRYLLRCRYRLRGASIHDCCIMCCIPSAAVEQQTVELAAHGLPPCIPPSWRHMD